MLMNLPMCPSTYSFVGKLVTVIVAAYRQPYTGHIVDLVIESTGLKVFGEY